MSKSRNDLNEELTKLFGPVAKDIVDYLYSKGTLDDVLVRNHVVKSEYIHRLVTTDTPVNQIYQDLAEDYGMTRERVLQLAKTAA